MVEAMRLTIVACVSRWGGGRPRQFWLMKEKRPILPPHPARHTHRRGASQTSAQALREFSGNLTADVIVTVERLYRPGRRVDATSVRLTGFTSDPNNGPGLGPPAAFAVEQRKDIALSLRIQGDMRPADSGNTPIPGETTR